MITKSGLYQDKLFIPSTGSSCFSVFRYKETSLQLLKEYAISKNVEEYSRVFIGFAVIKVETLKKFGFNIERVEEDGMSNHYNVCFKNYTVEKGISPPTEILEILSELQDSCKFHFDANKTETEWKGGEI